VVATAPALDSATVPAFGNLYGSSKDVGTIAGKLPVLSETGGKVNRVGFTRVELEGSLEKYGFYQDYTQESVDFDSDAELEMHVNREMIFGANEITEDMLQIDLLNAAGVVFYAGSAVSDATMTGVTANGISEVTYGDLSRLSVELDNNRCPKTTKVISGSRMVDTRVIRGGRVMFIGSELTETVERMTDYFGAQAFISVAHYADAGAPLNGEIGTVGQFRLVVVPEMMHWAGVGAAEGVNAGYRATGGKYDVFPMLVVGDGSFTTIGFQTSGNSVKFNIKHAKPGSPESYANDPYGETGFMSIKWYYGFMTLRGERIGLIKTVARI
jgi:N4-gp56 family major capsid protein